MTCSICGAVTSGRFCGTCGSMVFGNYGSGSGSAQSVSPVYSREDEPDTRLFLRACVMLVSVMIIISMLMGWVSIYVDIQKVATEVMPDILFIEQFPDTQSTIEYVFDSEFRQVYSINDLANFAETLNLLMDTAYLLEMMGDDFTAHMADFRRIELISEIGQAVPAAIGVARSMLSFMNDIMEDNRFGVSTIIGMLWGDDAGAHTAEDMRNFAHLLDLVVALTEIEDDEPGTLFEDIRGYSEQVRQFPSVATGARIVVFLCIFLMLVFLFLLLIESKISRVLGFIGAFVAFIVSGAALFGSFYLQSMLSETAVGDYIRISATVWLYLAVGLSAVLIILSIGCKNLSRSATKR